jgi:triacylglycerol esterase/lipase EstA (alpha/beta hydrolase family)
MASRPVVVVHGDSDQGKTASNWRRLLTASGFDATNLHVSEYVSLSNEVTIKDIAEGFDRSLKIQAGLSKDEEFDAIVHSTGMLVIRSWLTTYVSRAARLKHLIGLAPATFGSPMAHKGRSLLGGIFKGTSGTP